MYKDNIHSVVRINILIIEQLLRPRYLQNNPTIIAFRNGNNNIKVNINLTIGLDLPAALNC